MSQLSRSCVSQRIFAVPLFKVQIFNVQASISLTGSSLRPLHYSSSASSPPTPGSNASAARCSCTASSHLALVMEVLLLQDTHGLLDYGFLSSSILAVGVSLLFCSFSQLAASDLWPASSPPTPDSNVARCSWIVSFCPTT